MESVSISALWMPILLSAIAVFIVSSVIHMLLPYHRSNMSPLPDEQAYGNAVNPLEIPPGEYIFPHASNPKDMGTEAYQARIKQGPVGMTIILPNAPWPMGKSLLQWFIYSLVVGFFTAYIAVQALPAGADYLQVMRMVGSAAFAGYALALMQNSIWYFRAWSTTAKFMFDGLVYALVTGGVFGWLWPAA